MYSRNWNWGGGRMKEGREKRVWGLILCLQQLLLLFAFM
jgi:hypothetical protein